MIKKLKGSGAGHFSAGNQKAIDFHLLLHQNQASVL